MIFTRESSPQGVLLSLTKKSMCGKDGEVFKFVMAFFYFNFRELIGQQKKQVNIQTKFFIMEFMRLGIIELCVLDFLNEVMFRN